MDQVPTRHIRTSVLEIAYEERGASDGFPVVLLHGFPDDVRAWDAVVAPLVAAGRRTLAPYLRGCGPTRFLRDDTPRVGQLAACAHDVVEFADGLGLARFTLVGHDWGALAAQAVAALHPARVARLVTFSGYAISYEAATAGPPSYAQLHALWYQWLFNLDFGPAILEADRRGFCRYLWETWSPTWHFSDEDFAATAPSFDNPDFVEVIAHGYRRNAPGDPRYAALEARLAAAPPIAVPTVVLQGADDGVELVDADAPSQERFFTGGYTRRIIPGVGHFPHRERPDIVVEAVLDRAAEDRRGRRASAPAGASERGARP